MEVYSNLWSYPLTAGCTSTLPYITVGSTAIAALPPIGPGQVTRILVDSEWMCAVAVDSGNNRIYVDRGAEGSTAAAHLTGAQALIAASSRGLTGVQAGAVIDSVMSYSFDTTPANPTYVQHVGMSLLVPPGVPVRFEYEADISVYQGASAAQYTSPNVDFRLQNSAGTQVCGMASVSNAGGGGTARFRPVIPFTTGASGVLVLPWRFAVDMEPLASADLISLLSTVTSVSGMIIRCGEAGPQSFTARAL